MTDHAPFYSLLETLKKQNKKFDFRTLKLLSYTDLNLAAMGNAGSCRCSIETVIKEKAKRRTRYITQIPLDREFLKENGMLEDVESDRISQSDIPTWESLSVVAQLWFKLSCLEMHTDHPQPRISEIIRLFQKCLDQPKPPLPYQIAQNFKTEFQSILFRVNKLPNEVIRDCCTQCANVLYGFISGDEIEICDNLSLKNYSCSGGCFYPIGV